jgi:exopolyphosphatase/guanosine-5'-triphosphate,3'-diphosphate pyrophosphatase
LRLASIDVGTNSIHTIIVDVHADGSFEMVDRLKEMVRLGDDFSEATGLSSRAVGDTVQALRRARQLCERQRVDHIVAVATSAIREAPNGHEVVQIVNSSVDLRLKVLPAHEEARLIHTAVAASVELGGRRALVVDIGGGSVEFIVGSRSDICFADSIKAGVLRLRAAVPFSEPPTAREAARLADEVRAAAAWPIAEARRAGFDTVIATSGTASTLMSYAMQGQAPKTKLHAIAVSRRRLEAARDRLLKMTSTERAAVSAIGPGRADTIAHGAVLLTTVLEALGADEVLGCSWALREGVLLDYLARNHPPLGSLATTQNPRRRSVFALAKRFAWAQEHSQHVASLALSVFDHLRGLHEMGPRQRELLEFAGVLHDIGYLVNPSSHHKHSAYIVQNADLVGFEPEEIGVLAALCRYHRKRMPRKEDRELASLTARSRRDVEELAAILRVADGLDRTHHSLVHRVDVEATGDRITLTAHAHGDVQLELFHARQKSDLLARAFEREVVIRLAHPVLATSRALAPEPPRPKVRA